MNFVSRFKKRIVTLVQALFWSILSLLQFNTCLKIKSQITAGCSHLLRNKFQHVKSFQKMLFPFYFLFIDFALLRYRLHFETFLLLKKKLYVASHSILLWIVNQWNGVSEFYVVQNNNWMELCSPLTQHVKSDYIRAVITLRKYLKMYMRK